MMGSADREVRNLLERGIAAGFFPGAIAEWGHAGSTVSRCFTGRAEVDSRSRDVTADTWFDLASLTKPLVTTTLSLLAFRAGVLKPATRVGEVLCGAASSPIGDLEVHHLLTHTSGLPAWLPFYCLAEGRRANTPEALRRIQVECGPGERVIYSCVGFIVLGLMLEEVSGANLENVFRSQVLAAAGLEDDLGFRPDPVTRPVAGGASRSRAEERLVLDLGFDPTWIPAVGRGLPDDGNARFFGGAAGNAGLFGTARGVGRLTAEYCGGGAKLLSPEDIERAVRSQTKGLEQERGQGWQIASSRGCSAGDSLPATAFGHTGFTGVSVWAEPVGGEVWVLLTNRNHPGQRGVDLHPVRRRFHALTTGDVGMPTVRTGETVSDFRSGGSSSG